MEVHDLVVDDIQCCLLRLTFSYTMLKTIHMNSHPFRTDEVHEFLLGKRRMMHKEFVRFDRYS